jgi:multidrug resistance efflux pump
MFRRAPRTQRLPRASRILFAVVAVLSVLEIAAFGGTYLGYSRHYVSTDNAQVDGDQLVIRAPISGSLTDWSADPGEAITPNEAVGRIEPDGSGPRPKHPIRSPGAGVIAVNDVHEGDYVNAGTELAVAFDPASVYVTARVPDTEVGDVRPGQQVDVSLDAYPGVPVHGVVQFVQSSTASSFTYLPPPGTADPANPQRVDQYVPVHVTITDSGGAQLTPGLNATVHIHKT